MRPIKNPRALYLAKVLILPTGACFQLEIRIYLATGGTFKYFSQTFISKLRQTARLWWLSLYIFLDSYIIKKTEF